MTSTYTYSLSGNFGGNLNPSQLVAEINADIGIAPTALYINTNGDVVDIVFSGALSGGEQTILNGLVAAHVAAAEADIQLSTTGTAGTVMTILSTQTANRTVTLPNVTDTLVGRATIDTLTNKTISGATNNVTLDTASITTGTFADARIAASNVTQHEASINIDNLLNAPTGAVVGTTDVQTLTNKTLTAPIISSISNTGTLTLPTTTDTLVGRATTDTLTNKTFGDSLNMNTNKIIGLGTPTSDTDAASKGYVDSVASGLDVKASVVVASTVDLNSNPTISGSITYTATGGASTRGQITATLVTSDVFTVDGITFAAANDGSRILLKDQTTGAQNGIWTTTIVGTALTLDRATDFDGDVEVTAGAFTFVEMGTINADSGWVLATDNVIIIGGASGTALTWAQFSGSGTVTAGTGLTKTGTTINVIGSATILANPDSVEVNSSAVANQLLLSSGTVGTAATFGAVPLGNANAVTGTLGVANGGTGATTLTSGNFVIGNGTGAVTTAKAAPTGVVVGTTDTQTLTNKSFTDNVTFFQDNGDNTKKMQFELSGITTATTRTLTVPDADAILVGTATTQTLTNKTISGASNTVTLDTASITTGTFADARIAASNVTQHEASLTLNNLGGTLSAAKGGTGQSSYTTGDLIYASGTTTLAKLNGAATGNSLISGGVGVAPSWGKIGLATHVSGTLGVANGGTGATTLTSGNFLVGNGTGTVATTKVAPSGDVIGSTDTQTLTNKTLTSTTNDVAAKSLHSATTVVDVSTATAPTVGQLLTATSGTAATWQSLSLTNHNLTGTTPSSTTSASYITIPSMIITPIAGTYLVTFVSTLSYDSNGALGEVAIHKNATEVATSRVSIGSGSTSKNQYFPTSTNAVITANGTDVISTQWRISIGSINGLARTMLLVKIA